MYRLNMIGPKVGDFSSRNGNPQVNPADLNESVLPSVVCMQVRHRP